MNKEQNIYERMDGITKAINLWYHGVDYSVIQSGDALYLLQEQVMELFEIPKKNWEIVRHEMFYNESGCDIDNLEDFVNNHFDFELLEDRKEIEEFIKCYERQNN